MKFHDYLVPMVLSGEKTSTWRLFDDKDLSVGDNIHLKESGSLNHFADAVIVKVVEKKFEDLTEEDMVGHEKFNSVDEMYEKYGAYYNTDVGPSTMVKLNWFKVTKKF